ncbi:MAG: hypothetical protein BA066_02455 [Candidatus Korarchaeota archaeon NZ13-K]|nr:MAG: hypothetical protein BA066_02455 [Candidatus Korarchaeota archaeon NZ13-K]
MKKAIIPSLIALLLIPLVVASAQISYEVDEEEVLLIIERSGDVLLHYNLTISVISGVVSRYVSIGMPSKDFDVLLASEVYGSELREVDHERVIESDYYAVKMHPSRPIYAGESRTYHLEVRLRNFLYEDMTNPGNVGLRFTPSWFDATVKGLKLWVILPPGVKSVDVRNQPDYDNLIQLEDGRLALYWERSMLPPNFKLDVGISFPKEYVTAYVRSEENDLLYAAVALLLLGALLISIFLIVRYVKILVEKRPYQIPEVVVESLGVNKKLEPPEVAYLKMLEGRKISYGRILTIIALMLSRKGLLRIKRFDPLEMERLEEPGAHIRAYENQFLRCLDDANPPKEECLVEVIKVLHKRVNRELSGYSRFGTLVHYEKLVNSLWRKLSEEPPEGRLEFLRENLPWLLTDEDFDRKLREHLRGGAQREVSFPEPVDIWIWIPGRGGTVQIPGPAPRKPESREVPVVTDIERAADSIARSVEGFSSSIVRNLESFSENVAKAIVPERPRGTSRRVRVACACVSCACACACVSCACACAGGGVG